MKKYFSFALLALALPMGFVSCDTETDEEPGGTNVEKMAGKWDVTIDAYDDKGELLSEDPYGLGVITIETYNTANNDVDKMWISDDGYFWNFTFKMDVNYQARTFSATDIPYDATFQEIADSLAKGITFYDEDGEPIAAEKATIINGKILEGAATNLHGKPNDSIVFDIKFTDDDNGFVYRMAGQRYTGFKE